MLDSDIKTIPRGYPVAPALWAWWTGDPIPFKLTGTTEMVNGEAVELDLETVLDPRD